MRIIRRADDVLLKALILGVVLGVGGPHAYSAEAEPRRTGDVAIPRLCDAALRGDLRMVRTLLRQKTPVDVRFEGETPLMKALAPYVGLPPSTMGPPSAKVRGAARQRVADKIEIAKLLLKAGVDVSVAGRDGATALHFAVLAYAPEELLLPIVRDLIQRGAPVDARTSEGATPLQLAVWKKRPEIARALVAAGASLDARDGQGRSAADELIAQGNQRELEELRALASNRP